MLRVDVKPDLLRWARERSGLASEGLAHRFPQLLSWERGESSPTLRQLEDYAKATHTPIGFLFLAQPPVERVPIPDFRTMSGLRLGRPSPDLLDTVYLCQQRQDWYRDFARSDGQPPLDFIGSARRRDSIRTAAARMRARVGLDVEERRRFATWEAALRRLIEQTDSLGILVMVSGVVGSNNRRKLDPQEFRGFALSDPLAPLVFVNAADTRSAQMFTLAHELAHLWLGESAVSDAQASDLPEHGVERWCNEVAAEFLVPLELIDAELDRRAAVSDEMRRLARRFKVSSLVVLRRIHDTGALGKQAFWRAYREELQRLLAIPRNGSGGDFYATLGTRAGKRFARALVTSTWEGRTSFTEAFHLLGFRKMATFKELGRSLGVES